MDAPSKEPYMNPFIFLLSSFFCFFCFFLFFFVFFFFLIFFFFENSSSMENRLPSSTLHMKMMNVSLTSVPNDLVKKVFIWCVIIASMSG